MKAYAYYRFSSKKQELGDSLLRQISKAEQWSKQNNITLSDTTFEDLGISAFKEGGKRPALADMIKCIKNNIIPAGSYILFEDTDRLTRRGFKHAIDLVHELVSLDVNMVMLGSSQVFTKHNIKDLSSTLPLLLDADRAYLESKRKSVLVRAARKTSRLNRKIHGNLPFWLSISNEKAVFNKHLPLITRIVEYRLNGCSPHFIARTLNSEQITTVRGNKWTKVSIERLYTNPSVYGAKQYLSLVNNKQVPIEVYEGLYPAVCTKEQYLSMQPKRTGKGLTNKNRWQGLVRCGFCKCAMTLKREKQYTYFRCTGIDDGLCSTKGTHKNVDSVLVNYFDDLVIHVKVTNHLITNQLDALEKAYEVVQLPAMLDEINRLKQQISEEVNKQVVFSSLWDIPVTEQNNELRRTIKQVLLYKMTRKTSRYRIEFYDKRKVQFIVEHDRFGDGYKMNFVSDTKKLLESINASSV